MRPYEIIAAPFTLYWAATGTTFPTFDAAPSVSWTKIGTSGDRNYAPDGVTVSHAQTLEIVRALGGTGPIKALRTEEMLSVKLTLWDLLLEQYNIALNGNTVTTTAAGAGTAGFKEVQLYRGLSVQTFALLVRGDVSPEGSGWKSQYQVPVAFQNGSPEPVFRKNEPAGLALEFVAIEDPDAASEGDRFGKLLVQHQDAI